MKKNLGLILFAVVTISVGVVAYKQYASQEAEVAKAEDSGRVFKNFKLEDATAMNVQDELGQFKIKKEGEHWFVEDPLRDRADDEQAETAISNILEQQLLLVDTEGKTIEWAKYGLDQPADIIHVDFKNNQTVDLMLGSVRTYDNGYYVRVATGGVNEDKLYTGSRELDPVATLRIETVRNLRVLTPKAIPAKIRVKSDAKEKKLDYVLLFDGTNWVSPQKDGAKFDKKLVTDYIEVLNHMFADGIVANDKAPEQIAKYDLQKPERTLRIEYPTAEAGKDIALDVSFSSPKDNILYISTSENSAIYRISVERANGFFKELESFASPQETVPALSSAKEPNSEGTKQ